jgi:oxalate decarboxylase
MRELHWNPDGHQWQYYVGGEARMTVFYATSKARTFNYRAGDVGFVPRQFARDPESDCRENGLS